MRTLCKRRQHEYIFSGFRNFCFVINTKKVYFDILVEHNVVVVLLLYCRDITTTQRLICYNHFSAQKRHKLHKLLVRQDCLEVWRLIINNKWTLETCCSFIHCYMCMSVFVDRYNFPLIHYWIVLLILSLEQVIE